MVNSALRKKIRRIRLGALGDAVDVTTLQQLAANAGFTGSDVNVAAAIAMAESSGNPMAVGDKTLAPTNGPSIGLWQINIGSKANAALASWNLYDPQTNANAAFAVYQQQGFGAWTMYRNGRYQAYLQQSQPLTIDANTGEVMTDDSSVDPASLIDTSAIAGMSSSTRILLLTAAAIGIYLAGDLLFGD